MKELTDIQKEFANICAKFIINDLRGILKKYKINMKEFNNLFPKELFVVLIWAICLEQMNKKQVRNIIIETLKRK